VSQSYNNRERCIELLAKECQKYQTPVHNRSMMTSPLACHSTEDLWHQRNCDSSESISSKSSGHSAGTPSGHGHTNLDVTHPHIRSSQSYPYIPPSTLSGRVHDPTPRSSLPMASLDTVPPSHHVRGMDCSSPVPATVVQRGPFNFRPVSQLSQDSTSAQNGRIEVGGKLPLCNLPGGSPNAVPAGKQKPVTSEVRYRVSPSGFTDEWAGLTYLSTTSVFPTASRHLSNAYINPQQVWVSSPQMPTTYVSSLSSSCECLPSVTGASDAAVQRSSSSSVPGLSPFAASPCQNSNSPRADSEDVNSPEYINGM